jgi:hypothetical protein
MTPDASGVVAQVDAALLLALVVEAKATPSAGKEQPAGAQIASSYATALFCVFLSLGVTLMSVGYDKPLTACEAQASDAGVAQPVEQRILRQIPDREVVADALRAPGRIRTCDTRFRKPMLYPLSYEGDGH